MNKNVFDEAYSALRNDILIYFENSQKYDVARIFATDSTGEEYRIETMMRDKAGKCSFDIAEGGIIIKAANGGKIYFTYLPFESIKSLNTELFNSQKGNI